MRVISENIPLGEVEFVVEFGEMLVWKWNEV